MTRILGIDPGSRSTGFGIIEFSRHRTAYVASGCIRTQGGDLANKLNLIFEGITDVVSTYFPQEIVIEQVYVHRNPSSALKLGQARGAAILAGVLQDLAVFEYTPAQVKQAVTGKGNASKAQVQHMMRLLLGLERLPQTDPADALAVALCHAHTRETLTHIHHAEARSQGPPR